MSAHGPSAKESTGPSTSGQVLGPAPVARAAEIGFVLRKRLRRIGFVPHARLPAAGSPPALSTAYRRPRRPGQIAISTITLAELEYGVVRSRYPDRNRIALLEFLVPSALLDFDQAAAAEYGRIRSLLESEGRPMGPMDLLLAAQAKSHDLVLVTNNEKEFRRIEGLRIENWARMST
jgi:tRNA(fMet)-specific endonuclease VapC